MMSTAKAPQKRNYLILEKKVGVIRFHQKNPTTSIRALGEKFECRKTQIAYILNTISKCFRKAGILDTDLDVICRDADDEDAFLEANNLFELGRLIEKTGNDGCSSSDFVSGDDLPVCVEMDDDNWQSVFLDELTNDQEKEQGKKIVMMKLRMIVLNKRSCPASNHAKNLLWP